MKNSPTVNLDTRNRSRNAEDRKQIRSRLLPYILLLFFLLDQPIAKAGESPAMQGMTAAHNTVRNELGIVPLVWSDTLAQHARSRATQLARNNCRMRHELAGRYGENLYWASAVRWSDGNRELQDITPQHVVKSWQQEERDYDQQTGQCRKGAVCGHYTQIIWRDSKKLGCGMAVCADKGQIWVCNYNPPGNYRGQAPY